MAEVTQILNAIRDGQPQAAEELLPLVYDDCDGWPPQRSPRSGPVRRYRRRRWSTKPTCDWSGTNRRPSGNTAATSLPPRLRPCGAFSWRTPAGNAGCVTEADTSGMELAEADVAIAGPSDDMLALDEACSSLTRPASARRSWSSCGTLPA